MCISVLTACVSGIPAFSSTRLPLQQEQQHDGNHPCVCGGVGVGGFCMCHTATHTASRPTKADSLVMTHHHPAISSLTRSPSTHCILPLLFSSMLLPRVFVSFQCPLSISSSFHPLFIQAPLPLILLSLVISTRPAPLFQLVLQGLTEGNEGAYYIDSHMGPQNNRHISIFQPNIFGIFFLPIFHLYSIYLDIFFKFVFDLIFFDFFHDIFKPDIF